MRDDYDCPLIVAGVFQLAQVCDGALLHVANALACRCARNGAKLLPTPPTRIIGSMTHVSSSCTGSCTLNPLRSHHRSPDVPALTIANEKAPP